MPRSSLRRPPSHLDLGRYLREVSELPSQLSSPTLFGNDQPLEIEIGSGKGLFLSNTAQLTPGHNFVGVEIIAKYAEHAAARLRAGS